MKKRLSLVLVFAAVALNAGLAGERMTITGQVHDDQARVVEGADIAIYELHGDDYYSPRSAKLLDTLKKSDHKGRFVFNVMAEPHHDIYVIARKEGLALGWDYLQKKVDIYKRARNVFNIVLKESYTLSGRLVDFEGKSVEGANIQVFTPENGGDVVCEPKDWFSVKTESQGQFTFDNLPLDLTVMFYVEAPHRDIAYIYPPQAMTGNACGGYNVDWDDIELKLPPVTTIQGQLINKDTNQGIEGMNLILYAHEGRQIKWRFRSCETTSGAEGVFEIRGVPTGEHILRLVSPTTGQGTYVGKNVPIAVNQPDKTINAKVLIEKGIPLEVIIKDQTTGRAIPGFKLQIDDRWNYEQEDVFVQETRTDANGIAHLIVPKGPFKIHPLNTDYEDRFREKGKRVNITGSQLSPVEIWVWPRRPLVRGIVVDREGQPANDVHVTIGMGQRVLTDKDGRFEGKQHPSISSHMVVAQDTERNLVGGHFFYDALREQRIVLEPGSSVRGRVTDDMGRGVAGADVNLALHCKRPGGQYGIYGSAHIAGAYTDSEGYYRLDTVMALRGNSSYHVTIKATDFGPTLLKLTQAMKPGETITIPDMRLVNVDAVISGIVVDQRNTPVVGKSVNIHSQISGDLCHRSSSTDEQGQFKFNRLPEGPVTLQVGSYGGGLDAAYVWAHTGDYVRIKLGEHHKDYISPSSLVGQKLPDLSSLEIGFDPERAKNKKTLVCFVDVTQRASQSAIKYLNKIQYDLKQRNAALVCVQVTPFDEEEFNAWKKDNKI
ncbi:MAG: hypothetical protein HQ515_22915, partial [Phycisphaeraceae bacterium]|nr:hypothetical protein [Phycisphaeraceae bacterium]